MKAVINNKQKAANPHPYEVEDAGFDHSADYRSVVINGETVALTFSQAKVFEKAHQAYERGTHWVHQSLMVENTGYNKLKEVFYNLKNWRKYITPHHERRGLYGLNIPPKNKQGN